MNSDSILGTVLLVLFWLMICICCTPIREIMYSRNYQSIQEDENV